MAATESRQAERDRMVRRQLRRRGIHDQRVLDAMAQVPREHFVPTTAAADAYRDGPLPIGEAQTISQPYIVALMAQAIEPAIDDRVLEIGTGSGYGAAVLAHLVKEVITIERLGPLARRARQSLTDLGVSNVEVIEADGSLGWTAGAPYDGIVITAAAPTAPDALVGQLVEGGHIVVPVGPRQGTQQLVKMTRRGTTAKTSTLCPVRFVPLVGDGGHAPRR